MVQRQRTRTVRVRAMTFPAAAIGSHHRRRTVFGVLGVAYLVLGIGLLPLYRHQLNPDGVSY